MVYQIMFRTPPPKKKLRYQRGKHSEANIRDGQTLKENDTKTNNGLKTPSTHHWILNTNLANNRPALTQYRYSYSFMILLINASIWQNSSVGYKNTKKNNSIENYNPLSNINLELFPLSRWALCESFYYSRFHYLIFAVGELYVCIVIRF